MDKAQVLQKLNGFKLRLEGEVSQAYAQKGKDYGKERFAVWVRQISKFLDEDLPGETARLNKRLARLPVAVVGGAFFVSAEEVFWYGQGKTVLGFLDSLILDIKNDEYEAVPAPATTAALDPQKEVEVGTLSNRVFIVHGHDEAMKEKVARFLERQGLQPVILHEQANKGQTIIEKLETNTDVGFAVVLYTPDDLGRAKAKKKTGEEAALQDRARQNVVFEHGYLVAKLSRKRVAAVLSGEIESPSDLDGVVYIAEKSWQMDIAKEMRAAGYNIDLNKLTG